MRNWIESIMNMNSLNTRFDPKSPAILFLFWEQFIWLSFDEQKLFFSQYHLLFLFISLYPLKNHIKKRKRREQWATITWIPFIYIRFRKFYNFSSNTYCWCFFALYSCLINRLKKWKSNLMIWSSLKYSNWWKHQKVWNLKNKIAKTL